MASYGDEHGGGSYGPRYGEGPHDGYGAPPPGPAAPTGPPPSVRRAVLLIWVSVGLSLLSTVIGFVLLDDLIDASLDSSGTAGVDRDTLRAGVVVGLVFGLVLGVAIAALFAFFIGRGANWARIVYTVLIGVSVLFGLLGIASQPPLLLVLQLIGWAISVAIVVLLYRADSNAYFRRAR